MRKQGKQGVDGHMSALRNRKTRAAGRKRAGDRELWRWVWSRLFIAGRDLVCRFGRNRVHLNNCGGTRGQARQRSRSKSGDGFRPKLNTRDLNPAPKLSSAQAANVDGILEAAETGSDAR
jgi:hypothetical protein